MKQIYLKPNCRADNMELIGKTIKDISFGKYSMEEKSCLIMTFTDDTFIYLNAEEDTISSDCDYTMPQIKNDNVVPLKCYSSSPGCVYDGEFHYYPYIEEEIRMGLITPDREWEKQRLAESQAREEEREYELYLKLKEKYGEK